MLGRNFNAVTVLAQVQLPAEHQPKRRRSDDTVAVVAVVAPLTRSSAPEKAAAASTKGPFPCPYDGCGKLFMHQSSLKLHYRNHTGEKPYVCEFESCMKAFTLKQYLTSHIRTHTGEKPFVCEIAGCHKAYSQKQQLRNHSKKCLELNKSLQAETATQNDVPHRSNDGRHQAEGSNTSRLNEDLLRIEQAEIATQANASNFGDRLSDDSLQAETSQTLLFNEGSQHDDPPVDVDFPVVKVEIEEQCQNSERASDVNQFASDDRDDNLAGSQWEQTSNVSTRRGRAPEPKQEKQSWKCSKKFCGEILKDIHHLGRHMEGHKKNLYGCAKCGISLRTLMDIKFHTTRCKVAK